MAPMKSSKSHEDRLYDVCFFCRGKAGPNPRKISDRFEVQVFIREKCLSTFDEYQSILPKSNCENCRLTVDYNLI